MPVIKTASGKTTHLPYTKAGRAKAAAMKKSGDGLDAAIAKGMKSKKKERKY